MLWSSHVAYADKFSNTFHQSVTDHEKHGLSNTCGYCVLRIVCPAWTIVDKRSHHIWLEVRRGRTVRNSLKGSNYHKESSAEMSAEQVSM